MDFIKRIYRNSLDFVGDTPSFRQDARWLVLYGLVIYALVLALRLSFAGRWDHPELWVGGERIMSTHDAYYWLAKAKGVGSIAGCYLAQLAVAVRDIFGVGLGSVGFWVPAFMGALVGVICYLWGWLLGGRNAGIFAGLAGALTPGFFYRSRLGYFDTDMFTLLVPMVVTWMLAYWTASHIRKGWFSGADDQDAPSCSLWYALVFGLITRVGGLPHLDIVHFNVLCVFLAVGVILVAGRPGLRGRAIYGMTIFCLAAFPGAPIGVMHLWPLTLFAPTIMGIPTHQVEIVVCVALGAGLIVAYGRSGKGRMSLLANPYVSGVLFVACVLATGMLNYPLDASMQKVLGYFSGKASGLGGEKISSAYPAIMQSIIEAKRTSLSEILNRGVFFPWMGWTALAVGVFVVLLRPAAIFLVPLVVLHLASISLGIRFSMFGGGAFMIFLGVGLYWAVRLIPVAFSRKDLLSGAVQAVLGVAILLYAYATYGELPLTPVIPKAHAEALVELGESSPKDAMIWTWWDWGYASQYYAGRETVVDGGKHAGRDVFPVGFVMSTDSPERANHMVRFSAQYPAKAGEIGLYPSRAWDTVPRNELDAVLEGQLTRSDYPVAPGQYLVVSWKDMNIIKWITYFGNWDLKTGETKEATAGTFNPGELGINIQQGAVMNRKGGGGLVRDITVLDWNDVQKQSYFMNSMSPQLLPKRQHLLINKVTGQSVLMDRIGYRSLMRRLLTDDPNDPEISKYFKLVVDKLPFVRVYEVVQ